jgi:hypothetical protein
MSKSSPQQDQQRTAAEIFSEAELRQLLQRIITSGELGRSLHYRHLLEYLVQCSIEGRSPKEIDLAIEGLGRAADFDVAADSSVRVYVHQLRKKLDSYYRSHEEAAAYRIVIPKGQYRIAAEPRRLLAASGKPMLGAKLNTGLLALAILLLLSNLLLMLDSDQTDTPPQAMQAAQHPVWSSILDDDRPIMLVMGDYYIFGELNANGNVARMVREFNVNSASDLEELQFSDIAHAENYLDLDLSYMPEGSAFALTKIVPILQQSGKLVNISMMSDLTTAEIRNNHIVYIGYISALEKLTTMAFAGSGLSIGRSYDELVNTKTLEYYTSDAGLPEAGAQFRDYGLFATFPASSETQVILISGMRDAGLMHTAQALSNVDALNEVVAALDADTDEALASFEVLFEVFGIDRLNFNADLIYANLLDKGEIWGGSQAAIGN